MNAQTLVSRIFALDKFDMRASLNELGKQCTQAFEDADGVVIPKEFRRHTAVLIVGMGGSALGADFIRNVYGDTLKRPIKISMDYITPRWVSQDTLVVLSSYSGDTEETLAQAKSILERTNKVVAITCGGALLEWCKKNHQPVYVINPVHNPCGAPRLGIGYGMCGLLRILVNAGDIKIAQKDIAGVASFLDQRSLAFKTQEEGEKYFEGREGLELLKAIQHLKNKMLIIIAAEHLRGAGHILNNYLHESAKVFSAYFFVPECNHYMLESVANFSDQMKNVLFLFLESALYHPKNQLRFKLTKQLFSQKKIDFITLSMEGSTRLLQACEAVQYGGYVAYFLALQQGIDPTPIKVIQDFKKKMNEQGA